MKEAFLFPFYSLLVFCQKCVRIKYIIIETEVSYGR